MTFIEPRSYTDAKIDTVDEYTTDNGVLVEDVLLKDGEVDGLDLAKWCTKSETVEYLDGYYGATVKRVVYTAVISVIPGFNDIATISDIDTLISLKGVGILYDADTGTTKWRSLPDESCGFYVRLDEGQFLQFYSGSTIPAATDVVSCNLEVIYSVA